MTEGQVAGPEGQDNGTPGGGEEGKTWRETYLAGDDFKELREDPSLADVADVPTLAKRLVDTKAFVGRKGVIIPKEDAPAEEWEQYYQALGRPEKAADYGFKPPEGLPEGFPYSPVLDEGFQTWAHQAGLSVKQAQGLREAYIKANLEYFQQAQEQQAQAVKEMEDQIRAKWSKDYDQKLAGARKAMKRFAPEGSPELTALDKAIGDSPILAQFFYNIHEAMGEGQMISGGQSNAALGLEARKQEILQDPIYFDVKESDKNPEKHKQLVAELLKINQQLYPDKTD